MDWMTWETGNYLYFLPGTMVIAAWNWKSLIALLCIGLAILCYPFVLTIFRNTGLLTLSEPAGYAAMVSWFLWAAGLVWLILSCTA